MIIVYMKKRLFLPLIVAPILFMANSPAPWIPPQEYEDYKIISLSIDVNEYELNIENIGNKYIVLDDISYYNGDSQLSNPDVYSNQCLAPGDSGIYYGECRNISSPEEIKLNVYAVEVEGPASYTNVKFDKESVLERSDGKNVSWYYYKLEGIKKDKDFRYFSVVDLTIKGERFVYYSTQQIDTGFSFMCESGLSENDIQVENIYLVRGRKINHSLDFLNVIFGIFATAFAAAGIFGVIGVSILISFAVFMIFIGIPGIVLLIVKPWKKREKKE